MRQFLSFVLASILVLVVSQVQAAELSNIKQLEQEISDAVITTKITAQFTKSKNLNPLKLSVSTDNGVVTLSGHVKNKNAFVSALRIAKSTKGVNSVDTENLDIKRVNTAFADAYITAKVETAVLKAKVLDDESIPLVGINASTDNGVVTLTGTVKSDKSIAAILKRVSAIKGVKKIISNLRVDDPNENKA
ncbi:BON domain-containing protein [Legionella yabuuchiae]|uniref:BON domain-containing protein n=1 Tax=Legionella yabuuchiae TaxID=376727 RepID=UPI0010561355|nr:BON domain-containing protein [Legionella yabuuchiae]